MNDSSLVMNNGSSAVKIPKWVHLLFMVLSMVLVYKITVWSEGEVRDERYYQRSMQPADLTRKLAEKLFSGVDTAAVAEQYFAENVVTPAGAGRAALQAYYAQVIANGAQLIGVAGSGDTAYLRYTLNGQVRIDALRVQTGEIVEHTPFVQAGNAE